MCEAMLYQRRRKYLVGLCVLPSCTAWQWSQWWVLGHWRGHILLKASLQHSDVDLRKGPRLGETAKQSRILLVEVENGPTCFNVLSGPFKRKVRHVILHSIISFLQWVALKMACFSSNWVSMSHTSPGTAMACGQMSNVRQCTSVQKGVLLSFFLWHGNLVRDWLDLFWIIKFIVDDIFGRFHGGFIDEHFISSL